MSDFLVRGLDREAGLRVAAAVTTDLSREAVRRHAAVGLGACALSRALTSGLLLATLTKGQERVTVQLRGDGPVGGITVDALVDPSALGTVRGYLDRPAALPGAYAGRGRVALAVGREGVVNVVRDIGLKDRYQGQVALTTGEVDEDVEGYLRLSEQVPSALGCDVRMEFGAGDGRAEERIVVAAGVLVQALPGGDSEAVRPFQHALRTGALYELLLAGEHDARALGEAVYARGGGRAGSLEFIGAQPLRFQCRCSRERVADMLKLLTPVELAEMIAEEGHAEVSCNYCSERYRIERPELERIRAELVTETN